MKKDQIMISLYYFPFSQHSRRVISLMEEAGIEYQANLVDMMQGEHYSEAYLAINPNHQVPSLVDEDICLSESHAIMRYLCNKHQLSDWYPTDIVKKAHVDQWLDWNHCRLGPVVKDIVFNLLFAEKAGIPVDQNAIIKGKESLIELTNLLEKQLNTSSYLATDQISIADLALASNIFHLSMANCAPSSPAIEAWYDKISMLKGFQKSLPKM